MRQGFVIHAWEENIKIGARFFFVLNQQPSPE